MKSWHLYLRHRFKEPPARLQQDAQKREFAERHMLCLPQSARTANGGAASIKSLSGGNENKFTLGK